MRHFNTVHNERYNAGIIMPAELYTVPDDRQQPIKPFMLQLTELVNKNNPLRNISAEMSIVVMKVIVNIC